MSKRAMIATLAVLFLVWSCKAKEEGKEPESEKIVTVDVAPVTSSPESSNVTSGDMK